MRILVTGGGGYLGCVLVRQLLHDHHVVVLDRFSWGTQPLASITSPQLSVLSGDIRDATLVRTTMPGCDAVIHLAGVVGYPACDANPADADGTNVGGTRVVVEAAARANIPVYFASTGSTYGRVDGVATESTPLSPLTRYGRNKAEAEQIVVDVGGCALRLATLYGLSPRMRWDLLPHTFAQLAVLAGKIPVYDPAARRTFLHVEDAANAFQYAVRNRWQGVYNVGDWAQNLTKHEVALEVQQHTKAEVTVHEGHDPDQRDYAVRYDKVREVWKPQRVFDLGDVVAWARVWREGR